MNNVSFNPALLLKKQSSHLLTHKGQYSIQSAHKKQFSYTVIHKRQFSTQSVCKKQPSHLAIYKKQFILTQTKQLSNSVIFKKFFSISTASEKPFSSISLAVELDTLNHIAQVIQKGYQSKIKY